MQDIKDTYNMLLNARLSKTYLLITSSAINMSILAGVFIKMMVDTMDDEHPGGDTDNTEA